jgi:hypothetical protein
VHAGGSVYGSVEMTQPDKYVMDIECTKCGAKQSGILTVNTTPQPAQKPWVGLTIEDAQDVIKQAMHSLTNDSNTFTLSGNMIWVAIVNEVEAKLKEKNT